MKFNIEIRLEEKLWQVENRSIKAFIKSSIKKILPETKLAQYSKQNTQIEIFVLLTSDQEIQKLNRIYRKKNQPTDVLSFPTNDSIKNGNLKNIKMIDDFLPLGDIVLAYQTIKKEAQEQDKKFLDHLTHLIVHSLLHLLGYEHIINQDAAIMERLEIKLLKKFDIDNPYLLV